MDTIIVIAGSAGGLKPLRHILAELPVPCAAAVFVVMHIGPYPSVLPLLLDRADFPAAFASDGDPIVAGHIYVAPPDHHMILECGRIRLSRGSKVHYTRPSADPLFTSAAEIYGERVVGVVLSGGDHDGAAGLRAIKEHGGTALVQHPDEARQPSMPHAAIVTDNPDSCLSAEGIAQRLAAFCALSAGRHRRAILPAG
jgi:two-component system chemotaxis response regulator CheB